ncbi:MAG TPA: hypothetical protein VGC01_02480 [Mucilaginibacter sp.]
MSILITAATSAPAHRLKIKLNNDAVWLGDYLELPKFMLAVGNMLTLPNPHSSAYTHEMLTLCLDKGIDTVYLIRPEEAGILLKADQLFKEYNIILIKVDEI